MARPTSSGLSYLVVRKETGHFYYRRMITPDLIPFIEGEIALPWARKSQAVAGTSTIKVSLKTGDDATARDRWAQVHGEVQKIIQQAVNGHAAKMPQQPAELTRRQSLSASERLVIAEQVKHDLLAQHDLASVDPSQTSNMGKIIAGILSGEGRATGDSALMRGEAAAHRIEANMATQALLKKDFASADRDFVVRVKNHSSMDDSAPSSKVTQIIPGELSQRLAENGIAMNAETERKLASLAMLRAQTEAHAEIDARNSGKIVQTPLRPDPIIAPAAVPDLTEDAAPLVSVMLETWRKRANPKNKEWSDRKLYVTRFIAEFGDLAVDKIAKKHVRIFRDLHMDAPKSVPHTLRGALLSDLIEWGKTHPETKKLSWRTINTKAIGSISALIGLAMHDGHCEFNVCGGMLLDVNKDPNKIDRLPFSNEQIQAFLSTEVYTSGKPLSGGGGGEAGYWLPLLSCLAGARVEELVQLKPTDVKVHDVLISI